MIERLIGLLIRPVIIFYFQEKEKNNHIFQYLACYIDCCSRMSKKEPILGPRENNLGIFLINATYNCHSAVTP